MLANTVTVSGRKSHPVLHICRGMADAVRVARAMVADGYQHVRIDGANFVDA
jgi:hypothetical protein